MYRPTWAVAALLFWGCSGEERAAAEQAAATPPAVAVVVAEIGTADVPVMRDFVARTEAKEEVTVQARVAAILESTEFEEGRAVQAGQVLFRLETDVYEANVASAEAALAKAEADLKLAREQVSVREAEAAVAESKARLEKAEQDVARLRPLAEQDAVPRQDLDTALAAEKVAAAEVEAREAVLVNAEILEEVGVSQAEAAVKSAQAALDQANIELGYCTILCPLDGLAARTLVDVGNLVGRGESTELVRISSMDPMYVTLAISEAEYLQSIRRPDNDAKLELSLILADDSVYDHTGEFVTAESAVEIETGTLQLVAQFPNPELPDRPGEFALRPGQFGRVRLALKTVQGAVLVPQRAVMEQQGAKVVLVVGAGDKVALRSITVTERHEQFFVVVDGLEPGERVIVEGQLKARPGMTVQPTERAASSEPGAGQG